MGQQQFLTTEDLIAKAIRDYNLPETGWTNDAKEWVGEAVEFIGTNSSKVLVKKTYKVTTGEIDLPCDLDCIVGVTIDGCWTYWQNDKGLLMFSTSSEYRPYNFNGKLKFNKNEVEFDLYYYSFPTNCDGEVLVNNDIAVRDAVSKYILYRLIAGGMKSVIFNLPTANQMWEKARDVARNRLMYPAPYEVPYSYGEFSNAMV